MYNESSKNATIKYMKENRERLTLNFPLGTKEKLKAYAELKGTSLTQLILSLIEEDMKKHSFDFKSND